MTLDRWLELATAGLPPEVAGRVQAEYVAHVSESGLPEAEAIAALGQPEAVRRALGRTYLSAERLEILRDAAAPGEKLPLFAALGFSALWAGWTLSDGANDHGRSSSAVFCSRLRTASQSPFSSGRACSSRATAPAVCGAAIEVPDLEP